MVMKERFMVLLCHRRLHGTSLEGSGGNARKEGQRSRRKEDKVCNVRVMELSKWM